MAEERQGFAGYGYETAGGDRVAALRDMIDGGGKGRSGDKFEGGGILSLIANMIASPYGSERERGFGMIPASASPQAPMEPVRPIPRGAAPDLTAAELLSGDQAAYDAAFTAPDPTAAELLSGDQAAYDAAFIAPLPPGLVQSLSGGPSLASEMVAQGLPNRVGERSLLEILASLTPEQRQELLPQILASGIPMDQLLRR